MRVAIWFQFHLLALRRRRGQESGHSSNMQHCFVVGFRRDCRRKVESSQAVKITEYDLSIGMTTVLGKRSAADVRSYGTASPGIGCDLTGLGNLKRPNKRSP